MSVVIFPCESAWPMMPLIVECIVNIMVRICFMVSI